MFAVATDVEYLAGHGVARRLERGQERPRRIATVHVRPPLPAAEVEIFLSITARAVSVLTTRSKRMRGDRPNTVASLNTTGSASPQRSKTMFSLSTRVRAYSETGFNRERSLRSSSSRVLAP